jgi:hypothetical protein
LLAVFHPTDPLFNSATAKVYLLVFRYKSLVLPRELNDLLVNVLLVFLEDNQVVAQFFTIRLQFLTWYLAASQLTNPAVKSRQANGAGMAALSLLLAVTFSCSNISRCSAAYALATQMPLLFRPDSAIARIPVPSMLIWVIGRSTTSSIYLDYWS